MTWSDWVSVITCVAAWVALNLALYAIKRVRNLERMFPMRPIPPPPPPPEGDVTPYAGNKLAMPGLHPFISPTVQPTPPPKAPFEPPYGARPPKPPSGQ